MKESCMFARPIKPSYFAMNKRSTSFGKRAIDIIESMDVVCTIFGGTMIFGGRSGQGMDGL